MLEEWARGFTSRAAEYWTPERQQALLGNKRLVLPPVEAAPLLRALGLVNRDGAMPPDAVRKYMQVSHMVTLLEPVILDLLPRFPVVRVLDAGCGSSYLSMALAWCFRHRWKHPAEILGVDRNADVIQACTERAPLTLVEDLLRFRVASIRDVDLPTLWAEAFAHPAGEPAVHVLVSLHACDTATDDALALGVRCGAEFLACAPCCQAELARKWSALEGQPGALAPIWRAPHLRREAGATMTDTLRTLLLRTAGYTVTPMEFVPSNHTPKNTLLRAVKRGDGAVTALAEYRALREVLGGVSIQLEEILPPG